MKRFNNCIGILLIALTLTAHAQAVTSRRTLTAEGAHNIASIALAYARAHNAPGAAIAIVDAGGIAIYLDRLDGTFQNASNISIGKARTAVLFGKPTRVFEDAVNKGRFTMLAVAEVAPFTPLMGGVPIEINGQIAGAIGVSGAATAAQDDEIATAAAAEFVKQQSVAAAVNYVPRAKVEQGFRQDTTLINDAAFRVNTSRRDGPGEAEVHLLDTDIFYVQQGSAELITGGEVVSPHNTSATEIRGAAIKDGQSLKIAPGDVITIPNGVPHWFKQVKTPFTYYVVKSTAQ
jgi:uncharacterized protein GlcG (DUF336 family)/mannose-6-phosphate isomerase-like protein (cupin superfamily)